MKLPDPVAEVQIENDYWNRGHFFEGSRKCLRQTADIERLCIGTGVYTADQLLEVRRAALEEAAKVCESSWRSGYRGEKHVGFANVIRALIEKESGNGS